MRGGGAAVSDASATFTINLTNVTELNSIHGQRSFVRYLDILFDQAGSDLLNPISNNRLRLTRFDLDGNNGTIVPLPTTTAVGSQIQLDFGVQGIGRNRNTNVGDGYYQIALDMDQNGSFETVKRFTVCWVIWTETGLWMPLTRRRFYWPRELPTLLKTTPMAMEQ